MSDDEERYVSPTSIADVVEQPDGTHEIHIRIEPPSREEIADALARRLFADYSNNEIIRAETIGRFGELVRQTVDATAISAIDDAMGVTRPPTDEFGNPVGPSRTFAQMIGEQVKAWQEETVNPYDGKPKPKNTYGGSSGVITRAEYLVRLVGAAEFEKLAKAEVAAIRTDAKARIEKTIKDTVASSLAALAKA